MREDYTQNVVRIVRTIIYKRNVLNYCAFVGGYLTHLCQISAPLYSSVHNVFIKKMLTPADYDKTTRSISCKIKQF